MEQTQLQAILHDIEKTIDKIEEELKFMADILKSLPSRNKENV